MSDVDQFAMSCAVIDVVNFFRLTDSFVTAF